MPKHILDPQDEVVTLPDEEVSELLGRPRTEKVEDGKTIVSRGPLTFEVEPDLASTTFQIVVSMNAIVANDRIASFRLDPQTPTRRVQWFTPFARVDLSVTLEPEKQELSFDGDACLRGTNWLCLIYGEVLLRW